VRGVTDAAPIRRTSRGISFARVGGVSVRKSTTGLSLKRFLVSLEHDILSAVSDSGSFFSSRS
jgi:hypothetical protein